MEKFDYSVIESDLKCKVGDLTFEIDIEDIQKKIYDCRNAGYTPLSFILLLPDMKLYGREVEFKVRKGMFICSLEDRLPDKPPRGEPKPGIKGL